GRALVVTLELGLQVRDVALAQNAVRAEVARAGGYVADASAYGSGAHASARMELRVPARDVENVRASLGRIGEIVSDAEKVQDVTEERADLEARLLNARASEKRVLEIMATRAGAIHEVLDAEKELARIRESIERMEAQKRTLDGRVDLATVHVTLNAPASASPAAWQTPGKSIAGAGRAGLAAAQATGVYGLCAMAAAAPFFVPIGAVIMALVLAARARRRAALRAMGAG
ncbi:MAG: putative lipoprotein, partial [Labilithrix sp.]|nr:putative lipoprotein [Labilithrix sp.]